ncbi:MAG: [protein-PII] uridylyltransferase [Proteobacteria bacterium]|nr:[protein-PII] uridylyltransferase [Pseudomonadota bacterium]
MKNSHPAKVLNNHRKQMISQLIKGKAPSFLTRHAELFDTYFHACFEISQVGPKMDLNKNPYAIVALGGYGRCEQCVHSDIDLLILFENHVSDEAEELVRELIYPLWDIGIQVSYATVSLEESVHLCRSSLDALTSVLDARFISGLSPVYSKLVLKVMDEYILPDVDHISEILIKRSEERHIKFGDSTFLLEPDLKDGQGGLRDYHTMLWLARVKAKLRHPRDLEYSGYLSYSEYGALKESLEFIWSVRNRLHYLVGRKYDQLRFEYQTQFADIFKFKSKFGQSPVERFLGELHGKMEFVKQHHLMFIEIFGNKRRFRKRGSVQKESKTRGIEIRNNMLYFRSSERVVKSPVLLIKIFRESARMKLPLSAESKRIVAEFGYLADGFCSNKDVIKDFETILISAPMTFNVLNEMLNTGLLSRIIPEFKRLKNRIQYNQYHIYPVDKHTLHTVRTIKQFAGTKNAADKPLLSDLYKNMKSRKTLLWAALLHDIGKGVESDSHSETGAEIAKEIMARAGYEPKVVDAVRFLVKEHLFLVNIAKRRDLNDEETAISCARRIKDVARLKMLYLLTVGDSMSTGTKAWNDWVAMLLRDLFLKVLKILEKGELAGRKADKALAEKKEKILSLKASAYSQEELEIYFKIMPQRYFLYMSAEDIFSHTIMHRNMENRNFSWTVSKHADTDTRTVTILGKDRPGLFATLAGVFSLNKIDIFNVETYVWGDGTALDIFTVGPPVDRLREDEKWEAIEQGMQHAMQSETDLLDDFEKKIPTYTLPKNLPFPEENRVVVDNDSSSFFTIIEVFTYDSSGLLFRITKGLFRLGLDIRVAKVSTDVDQVVDVFYVCNLGGEKVIEKEEIERIRHAVLSVLPDVSV